MSDVLRSLSDDSHMNGDGGCHDDRQIPLDYCDANLCR